MIKDKFIFNPTINEIKESTLDLVIAGTNEGVLMVESEAKELPEEKMLEAVNLGHEKIKPVINAIINLAETCAKEPLPVPEISEDDKKYIKY